MPVTDVEQQPAGAFGVCTPLFESALYKGLAVVVSFAIGVASIAIGSSYLHDECPIETRIPAMLIAGGVIYLYFEFFKCFQVVGKYTEVDYSNNLVAKTLHFILSLTGVILMIVTSVFVYSVWGTVKFEDPGSPMYCHKVPYMFAFVCLTYVWIFILLTVFLAFCSVVVGFIRK